MNILDTIVAQKLLEVAALPQRACAPRADRRDFAAALRQPRAGDVALIAEVKKASPSAGILRGDFDPVRIAREYEAAGATCISVLTDAPFFQGSLDFLRQIREAVRLPLLRKDFTIDDRQIAESVDAGADAVLLIAAILTDEQLRRLHSLAGQAGLAALVEVHDEVELDRALAAGATLIGVNNRDLKTFKVDLGTTGRLAAQLARAGSSALLVAESGINTRADVERVRRSGAQAVLVGEALMRERDIAAKVKELLALRVVSPAAT